jgi:mRNA interferase MazF
VVVVQDDALNRSRLATVLCVPLTRQLKWADAPGNVLLEAKGTGLPEDSVANVSQLGPIDRNFLEQLVGRVSKRDLARILTGINLVLGRG